MPMGLGLLGLSLMRGGGGGVAAPLYGSGTPAGSLLGSELTGLAIDFVQDSALVRWPASPGSQFSGTAAALLTYTTPPTKFVCDVTGTLVSGTTLRTNHHPVTHLPLGLAVEDSRTNVVLWNRDLTNVAWTSTNITAAKDQTGVDGVTNAASSILATGANGTCLQAITLTSSARFQSAFVKRLVGSGTVEMTMNGGTTWVAVTVTADWTRVSIPTQTLANPSVGFRIVTSGDKIAVDLVQNENGNHITTPIAVTTTAVTRLADYIHLLVTQFPFNALEGTLAVSYETPNSLGIVAQLEQSASARIFIFQSAATTSEFNVTVTTPTAQIIKTGATLGVIHGGAAAYKLDDFAYSFDGGTVGTDTSGALPAGLLRLQVGGVSYAATVTSAP
jgi:hypothetical protein